MAIPPISNGQIVPNGEQPFQNQQNFGQMIGEISSWVSHCPVPMIQNYINNIVRTYYDRRNWAGLMTKGQIVSPGFYSTGNIQLTQGSPTVIGTNTNWTATLGGQPIIGQQLRVGFTSPIYTITGASLLTTPQTLTLELPWGNQSVSSTGYYICQYYYEIPNVRFFVSVKNLQMMFRLVTGCPQALLENFDPSRIQMIYPRILANMCPSTRGNPVYELWPCPNFAQSFPYIAYVLPPNLVDDEDNLPMAIRCDIVKAGALADALLYKPKLNPGYSESACITISASKRKEFEMELEHAAEADEGLYRQNIIMAEEMMPYANIDIRTGSLISGGSYMSAMSAVMADDY